VIELNLGDFVFSRTSPKPLPPGTTAEIVWAIETEGEPLTWPAQVVGNTVSWRVQSEQCTAAIVPHGTAYDMFIHYPTDGESLEDFHWKTGRADRVPADE
jgi:hypothetical protein